MIKPSVARSSPAAAETKPAAAKSAAAPRGRSAVRAAGGPVNRMHAALATAVAVNDPQWQEF